MRVTKAVQRFIYGSSRRRFATVVLACAALRSGIWMMPNLEVSRRLAENPFVNPLNESAQHYLLWNWLGPWFAWVIGATSPSNFFLLHLAAALAFSATVASLCFLRLEDRHARTAIVVFALLPVSATSLFWVGMDGVTLLLMALAFLFPAQPAWALLVGTLLGMQHFESALVASLLLLFVIGGRTWLGEKSIVTMSWSVALLFGAMLGKASLGAIFTQLGMEVTTERAYWVKALWPSVLKEFVLHAHVTLWSVLALGWIVLVRDVTRGRRTIPLAIALLAASILLVLVFDQTRVLAIVTFPLLFVSWLQDERFLATLEQRFVAWLFLGWLVVPWAWAFGGYPQWSVLPYDVAFLLGTFSEFYRLPEDLAWWPFHYTGP